jgi:preprotein translocase subunit SecA
MKASRVAAPGIVLGSYPERHHQAVSSALLRFLAEGLPRWRETRLARHHRCLALVRGFERELAGASAETLRGRTFALRAHLARDGFTEARAAEALAIVSMTCGAILGSVPYDTQLMAARVMLDGHLAEMATGEGKTLAAALTAAIAALAGIPVHVVTANDYLVARDAAALHPLYQALGLTAGAVVQNMDAAARRAAYACDVTYCTAKELVFDYLRDRLAAPRRSELEEHAAHLAAAPAPAKLLRGLCMAIIDEADSVLIDEARVPLILSGVQPGQDAAPFHHGWRLSAQLEAGVHFSLDAATRSARLTAAGCGRLKALIAQDSHPWPTARHCQDIVVMALTARHLLERGRDFLAKDGRVEIIDETTGRTAQGRSWSHGLHQLVEIKEGCAPSPQISPLVQITYQRFFQRYLRLCGLSGTLRESRYEVLKVYGRQIAPVPLRCPDRRRLLPPRVFTRRDAQWSAVVARVQELHVCGRPVLIGTGSVSESEALSRRLQSAGLPHAVLNARQDRHEAAIIAAAGAAGAITVSTNMAGRGTDIILRGTSAAAGGLHVICCQQNAARRIDRQLMGRCARQGDPGSAETYIALDGVLLARHWLSRLVKRCTRREEMRHSWLGALALRLAQREEEHRQRMERESLMRRDEEIGDWFAFSGPEH